MSRSVGGSRSCLRRIVRKHGPTGYHAEMVRMAEIHEEER